MQGILKEIYDYKVDLINHLKAKETQKSLESKISSSKKSRGFINKIDNNKYGIYLNPIGYSLPELT